MKSLSKVIEYLEQTEMSFEEKAKIIAIFSSSECMKYVKENGEMTPEIAYNIIGYGNSIKPTDIIKKDPKQNIIKQKHWDRAVNDDPYLYHSLPRPFRTANLGKLHVVHKLNHMGPKEYSNADEFLKRFRKSQLRATIAHADERNRARVLKQLRYENDLWKKEENTITYEDCFNAIDLDPMQIRYTPLSLIDKNLCIMAVYRKGSKAFNYIPNKFISKPMIRHAIKNDSTIDFKKIRDKNLSEDIYYLLIKYKRIKLDVIPLEMRTLIMCILAVYIDNDNFNFIPDEIINNDEYKSILEFLMV